MYKGCLNRPNLKSSHDGLVVSVNSKLMVRLVMSSILDVSELHNDNWEVAKMKCLCKSFQLLQK